MLSRALSIATVTILVGCLTAVAVRAVENLEAGKSPSQIFAGTCTACHKSPRGVLKTVQPSSLPGFLRQHYTTSSDMASVLSSFLVSNGASDTRYQGRDQKNDLARQRDARQDPRPEGRPDQADRAGRRQQPPAQEASRPEADGLVVPQGEGRRSGRDNRRHTRPAPTPDGAKPADGEAPVQPATDSKPGVKQRLGKRGRHHPEEPAKTEATKRDAVKDEPSRDAVRPDTAVKPETGDTGAVKPDDTKPETAKTEGDKTEALKPAGAASETKSESAKVDAPKEGIGGESSPLRSDPPAATPPASSSAASGASEPSASPSSAEPAPAAAPASPASR